MSVPHILCSELSESILNTVHFFLNYIDCRNEIDSMKPERFDGGFGKLWWENLYLFIPQIFVCRNLKGFKYRPLLDSLELLWLACNSYCDRISIFCSLIGETCDIHNCNSATWSETYITCFINLGQNVFKCLATWS